MNIDRLLSIHQSHSLMKIGAINKQILIAQYAQCEQIAAIKKEISASNSISRQILENQLKEIKHRELLRYYKSLAYAMKEAAEYINTETNIAFKCFLHQLYSAQIIENIREAKSNLEDIPDKEYCTKIEMTMQEINKVCSSAKSIYEESHFFHLLSAYPIYTEQQNVFTQKQHASWILQADINRQLATIQVKPSKDTNRGCWIKILSVLSICGLLLMIMSLFLDVSTLLAMFIVFFLPFFIPLIRLIKKDKRWRKNYNSYINGVEQKKKALLENLNKLKTEINNEELALKTSQYVQIKHIISTTIPQWENIMSMIELRIPKVEAPKSKDIEPTILFDVAKYVVINKTTSISVIQRHFNWGYRQTEKYLNKLSELGIIKDNKAQIQNEGILKEYWKLIKNDLL